MTDPLSTGKSGKGIDTLFDRDAFGRLLQETTPDGVTTFRYNRAGQMTEAENAHRKLRWQYDAAGRLIGDWQGSAEIRHEYDAAGNRIASLLPNGEKLRIGYNATGQFQSLHRTPAGEEVEQLLAEISRDELGRETQRLHGNGLATESQYDPQGRLQKMRLGKTSGPVENPTTEQPVLERAYGYNRSGQLSQIDDSLRGTRKYHYDALDRLTQVEGPNPEHFIHDPAHNILAAAATPEEAKQQASATQVTGNRLKFRGDTHYEYDIHGNRIAALRGKGKKLQTRYRYNSKHQLIAVAQYRVDDTGEAQLQRETQYQYDPLGRRIAKSYADKRIEFLWYRDVLLQEQTAQSGSTDAEKIRTYYFEPGTFKPLALSENDEIYHYHLDHLGTPDTLTNGSGEVAWSVSYKSYGNLAVAHCNEVEQPIRFQGQYFDEESGLHYNRFRYYDPECGQFTQQDPIGLLGGVNNYRYAPNPTVWVDPLGLTAKKEGPVRAREVFEKSKPDFYVGPAGPSATVPSTAYRYERYLNDDGTEYVWGQHMLKNKEGQVTYFGFEKYETGLDAGEAFQVKQLRHTNPLDPSDTSWSDTRIRGEFDTLQLFDQSGNLNARTPRAFGDKLGASLEPITEAYPQYGAGGAQQLHADRAVIKFDKVDILPEK